ARPGPERRAGGTGAGDGGLARGGDPGAAAGAARGPAARLGRGSAAGRRRPSAVDAAQHREDAPAARAAGALRKAGAAPCARAGRGTVMKPICREVQDKLAAEGAAALRDDAGAQRHLEECSDCFLVLERLAQLDEALRALPVIDAPDAAVSAALAGVQA